MDITIITKLITIILAISLASERLVTLLKTLFPWLASKNSDPATGVPPPVEGSEKWRQIIVMLIAFVCAWLTASFLKDGTFRPGSDGNIQLNSFSIPVWIIGLLASGGSAFWTSLLGYTQAVKNLNTQKFLQEKMAANEQLAAKSN